MNNIRVSICGWIRIRIFVIRILFEYRIIPSPLVVMSGQRTRTFRFVTLGALAGWVRGQPSLLIFVAGSTTPSLIHQTMQLSVLNLGNCFRWIRFRFWNLRFYRAPELLLASTSYRCWTIFSKLKTKLNEFSLQHFCGSLEPWLCVGRDGAAQAGFQRSPKYFLRRKSSTSYSKSTGH